MEIDDSILAEEQKALETDAKLYLECLNNKLLKDRKTEREIRDGLILFHSVYKFIKRQRAEEGHP